MTTAPSDKNDAALDAALARLGLAVAPEWRRDVLAHMAILEEAAKLLHEFPLDDSTEVAPVFTP